MLDSVRTDLSPKQIWMLAIRPKTLPAAASTAIVGAGAAIWMGKFQLWLALAGLATALLLQIGANLANDVFDYYRGADTSARLGPVRVTQSGLLRPAQVIAGMWVVFGLAGALGLYMFSVAGWPVLVIGLACVAAAFAYSGGPAPYGYVGLGDLLVFIFFGPVAVIGVYYVQALSVDPVAVWSSLPMGFLITAILVVNNLRDIDTDAVTGKKTMAVRLGRPGTRREYSLCLLAAYLVLPIAALVGAAPWWGLLAWLSIPLAIQMNRAVWTIEGRPLNQALAGAGRLTLVFGLLYSLGLLIAFLIRTAA